jgi:hypothetical protein
MPKKKKNFPPIVQPLAHPNTKRNANKTSIFGAFQNHFSQKKWCSGERVKGNLKSLP